MSSKLFTPIQLRDLSLANRVVVSPMGQYNSTNGVANDWHLMHLAQFSLGGGARRRPAGLGPPVWRFGHASSKTRSRP